MAALPLLHADLAAVVERLAVGGTGLALRSWLMRDASLSTLSNIITDFIRLIQSIRSG